MGLVVVTSMSWARTVDAPVQQGTAYRGKRVLDVVVALLLLVLLSPLLLVVAVAVVVDSRGPVLFRQARAGRLARQPDGTSAAVPFTMLKFRSMTHGADTCLHEQRVRDFVHGVAADPAGGARFKPAGDLRVTRLGGLLRRTSLDELPQLVNVVRGDMSLVGPRPVPLYEFAHYDERARQRLRARPGITGLWQVCGRCDTSFAQMVDLDLQYVADQSLALDLQILLKTVPEVLTGRGAA